MRTIKEFFDNLYKDIWLAMALGYRVLLLLLLLVSLGAVVGLLYWSTRPDYEILSENLKSEEISQLVDALEADNIKAQITRDGTAVKIPRSKRHQARMVAAREGLSVVSVPGFEMFQDPKIGMTPFAERVNYLSALQNELSATISTLDGILHARVHLAIPERQLFQDDTRRPSASVLVTTRASHRIGRREAKSIANLVSSAVEGMSPGDVTITDSRGNVVAGIDRTGSEAVADDQFLYRQRIENELAHKAESMLARVLGPGRSEVRVSAELNFQDQRTHKKTYDPDNQVLVSEKITTMSSSGPGLRIGGRVAETMQEDTFGEDTKEETRKEDIDSRFLVGESRIESIERGALITRLSVAAFVNIGEEDGNNSHLSLADVEEVLEDALGIDRQRGDTIRVARARFFEEEVTPAEILHSPILQSTAKYIAITIFGLILFFAAKNLLKNIESALGEDETEKDEDVLEPEVMTEEEEEESETEAGEEEDEEKDEIEAWGQSPAEILKQQVTRLVAEDPKAAGKLLESWVEEDMASKNKRSSG